MTTKEEIIERLDELNEDQQREILRTIETLKSRPKGEPGWLFLERTKNIRFDDDMIKAIEEAFDNIDDDPDVNFDE